jgi:hypothetical protein
MTARMPSSCRCYGTVVPELFMHFSTFQPGPDLLSDDSMTSIMHMHGLRAVNLSSYTCSRTCHAAIVTQQSAVMTMVMMPLQSASIGSLQ